MSVSFSTGVDICSVERMRLAIERGRTRFLNRVFTRREQAYCSQKRNKYENFAARFAAKEAVIKAKKGGKGRYAFRLIEVVRDMRGAPSIYLSNEAREQLGISKNVRFELTLSHERQFAIAFVVMFHKS